MRVIAFILIVVILSQAKQLKYYGSLYYIYDSNIGQNRFEEGGNYFVPKLGAEYGFSSVPISVYTDVIYDFYITERDFDDNSPFFDGGISSKLQIRRFYYTPTLSYQLYLANRVFNREDRETIKIWEPVFQTYSFASCFALKQRRWKVELYSEISYNDYGEIKNDTISLESKKEGYYFTLDPKYIRIWKVKKKDRVKFSKVSGNIEFKHAFLDKKDDSYDQWRASILGEVKLFYPNLSCKIFYGKKYYLGSEIDPHSGDPIWGWKSDFGVSSKLEIPVISDFSVEIGSKIKFRRSNLLASDYNRYVLSVGLLWDSGF